MGQCPTPHAPRQAHLLCNKGTSNGAATPSGASLAWTHVEQRGHELRALLLYPWERKGKAAVEGRVAGLIFILMCVRCVYSANMAQ
jgi:hypothetical protein